MAWLMPYLNICANFMMNDAGKMTLSNETSLKGEMPHEKKSTIIRTVVLVLALINQILTATGHAVIPVGEEEVSTIITVAAALWAWWKNNSFTKEAREADYYLERLKKGGVQ